MCFQHLMSDILRIKRLFMRDGMLAVAKKPPSKYELFEVSIQNTVSLQREFVTRQ